MIKIIGKEDCSACIIACEMLQGKNIDFEYLKKESMEKSEYGVYRQMAMKAKVMSMPIIIKDDKIAKLEEIIESN